MVGRELLLILPGDANTPETAVVAKVTPLGVIKFSLRTANDNLAKLRNAAARMQIDEHIAGVQAGPRKLDQIEAVALSKEVYQLFIDGFHRNPGSPEMWAAVKGFNRAVDEGRIAVAPKLTPETLAGHLEAAVETFGPELTRGIDGLPKHSADRARALEERFGDLARWVLGKHQLNIDAASWAQLLKEVSRASTDAFHQLKRNALGDYSPDPNVNRFPDISTVAAPKVAVTFQSLFDAWADPRNRRQSSIDRFRIPFLKQFPEFIRSRHGHDDPTRVTKPDVVAWRQHLLQSGQAPSTVKGVSIASLNSIYGKAVRDAVLNFNPAAGVEVEFKAAPAEEQEGFSDKQAKAILLAARAYKRGPRESPKTHAFIRWAAFVGAYTGMRIGEIAQLRKQDVSEHEDESEGLVIVITPEAGTTKSGKSRFVPIHPALVEEGFVEWVGKAKNGPLFAEPSENKKRFKRRLADLCDKAVDFLRSIVPDESLKRPSHAWRHRFSTVARRVGISEEKRDFILGHKTGDISSKYGKAAGLRTEIEKIPNIVPPLKMIFD
jgi:integrase